MSFPNAKNGISKILTAQWLQIIATVLMLIGAIAVAVFAFSASTLTGISEIAVDASFVRAGVGAIVLLVGLVVGVVAIILQLVGLNAARKDEAQFNMAFIICIFSLIAAVLASVLQAANPAIAGWLNFAQKILSLAVIEYVAGGIISLSEKLNNQPVANLARKLRVMIMVLYVISIILTVFAKGKMADLISIVSFVVELVVMIVYLVLLMKAKKMLV